MIAIAWIALMCLYAIALKWAADYPVTWNAQQGWLADPLPWLLIWIIVVAIVVKHYTVTPPLHTPAPQPWRSTGMQITGR